jgi:hypothetical protein
MTMRPEDSIVVENGEVIGLANGIEVVRIANGILHFWMTSRELEVAAIYSAVQYKAIREYQRLRDLGKLP